MSKSIFISEKTLNDSDWVTSVAFSVDGSRIVSGSNDKTVKIWNAATGDVESTLLGHSGRVTSVAFSVDGSRIVSGSGDKTVKIWNAATGEVENTLLGHSSVVTSVAFSVDGSRIVSGSWDKTVKIWNAATGDLIETLLDHSMDVTSVAFSHDGSRIVSGSNDHTVKIWWHNNAMRMAHIAVGETQIVPTDVVTEIASFLGATKKDQTQYVLDIDKKNTPEARERARMKHEDKGARGGSSRRMKNIKNFNRIYPEGTSKKTRKIRSLSNKSKSKKSKPRSKSRKHKSI